MLRFRRSAAVILLMSVAAPVWGVGLRPSGLTIGRALILLAAVLLALEWLLAPRPRPGLPNLVRLLIIGVAGVWVWTAANAETWGCGTCGGDLYGLSEFAALLVVAVVACTLEPKLRPALVVAILAGGTLEAVLALAGAHGLSPGTVNTSSVQGRLAGTFGNPNGLGLALSFSVPAGLVALPAASRRRRPVIIVALGLVIVALALTLSRSGLLAAALGGALVLVLLQPPRSLRRRALVAGLVAAAAAVAIGYPLLTSLRQHADTRPIAPSLRLEDRSGWYSTALGMVRTAGATLQNPATGGLEIRAPRAGQGITHVIGAGLAHGRYEVSFQARAVSGSAALGFALEGNNPSEWVVRRALVSPSWERLHVRWRPTADSPYAGFSAWAPRASRGFVLRDITVSVRPPGATAATRSIIGTQLKGSEYSRYSAAQRHLEQRDIQSRLFGAREALSAFATQPLRGIGWGRFTAYAAAHGNYGNLPTHDEYLRFLAELGIIGVLLLAFVGSVVAWGVRRSVLDQLGIAVLGILVTGVVGLVFINGLVQPAVMMPLAFAAAVVCARAGAPEPAVTDTPVGIWSGFALPSAWADRLKLPERAHTTGDPPERDTHGLPQARPTDGGPSPPRGYRPALDGLRAVAVLGVIGYHLTTRIHGGFLGVDVFFVLSGYLITSILLRERLSAGRIRLADFWARRARRLLPAVALLVLVCAIEVSTHEDVSTWALRRSDLLSTLFYYANWHFIASDQSYFAGFLGASPVRHTWTLAIEEQFYLVWPLVVLVTYWLARRLRLRGVGTLLTVIAGGIVASAIAMATVYSVTDPSRAYFGTDARASSLLIGAALAVTVMRRPEWLKSARGRALARWAPLPITIVALGAFALFSDQSGFYYHGGALIFCVVVALAIFVVEAAPDGLMARALSILPLRWTGRISYGLYLWYWPVLVWSTGWLPADGHLRKLLELAIMFGAAATSFYLVEQPIRTGRLPGLGLSRRRLAIVMPIMMAAVVVATVQMTTLGSASLAAELSPTPPLPCPGQFLVGTLSWCPRFIGRPGAPIVASIGDSTGQALYPGMREAARRRGWTYIEAAEGGCSILPMLFVEFDTAQDIAKRRKCLANVPRIIAGVQRRYRPDVWVLSDRWQLAPLVTPSGRLLGPTDRRRDKLIRTALRAMLVKLTADGARVLYVETPPPGAPVDCALHKLAASICASDVYSVLDPATIELANDDRVAARGLRRVTLVSVNDVVCPNQGHCPAMIHGTVVRYDGIHYSGAYTRSLVPIILRRAQRLGLSFTPHRR